MKKSSLLAASIAAASATAVSYSTHASHQEGMVERRCEGSSSSASSSSSSEKFAPRFDGLRFIETLVTAHR
ncbi:hypothetical protein Lal_00045565 [Lupinus albus]|uniref:Uncharacterized protein n=1 Tax=Lupinus albus TaxID=3870 RepID=A0A6A5NRY8_LUPAL|nr:hypothetical protein Lalb_Chr14g0366901 [Lupinus albus]KAF1886333.1 hypothetical protein Lal_00045565 [Lupinus albus]